MGFFPCFTRAWALFTGFRSLVHRGLAGNVCFSFQNKINSPSTDPKHKSDFLTGLSCDTKSMNFRDFRIRVRKFSCRTFNASCVRTVYKSVRFIFLVCSPAQIFEFVVLRISIWKMTTFHSLWTRPNKCGEDKSVYSCSLSFSIFTHKFDRGISSYFMFSRCLENFSRKSVNITVSTTSPNSSWERFHPSSVANTIESFPSGNVPP